MRAHLALVARGDGCKLLEGRCCVKSLGSTTGCFVSPWKSELMNRVLCVCYPTFIARPAMAKLHRLRDHGRSIPHTHRHTTPSLIPSLPTAPSELGHSRGS